MSRARQQFGVDGLVETDTAKLNTFLDEVSLLTVDRYVPEPKLKDSLSRVPPSMTLLVTDIGKRSYKLDLFGVESPRRVFGIIGDARVAVLEPRTIRRLLRPKSYFRKK